MNCPRHEQVCAYMDDMLAPSERQQFAAHVQACSLCRQRMDELLMLSQSLRELPSPALGFDLAARLEARIHRHAAPHRPLRSFWANWGAPGVAIALSVASGTWIGATLIGGSGALAPAAATVRVFDPVPPGGLCAATELCGLPKGVK